MPYIYKFTNELEQFGLCSFKLELTDTDGVLPELSIPVIFKQGEDTEENQKQLAAQIIEQQSSLQLSTVEETVE